MERQAEREVKETEEKYSQGRKMNNPGFSVSKKKTSANRGKKQ